MRRLRCRFPYEPWCCSCCGELVEGKAPVSVVAGLACEKCVDLGRRGEPYVPLTVRMVNPRDELEQRSIVAVSMRDRRCVTEQGETFDLEGLVARVRERKPGELGRRGQLRARLPERLEAAFIVTDNGLDLLSFLDHSDVADSPLWQWQAALRAPSAWRPEARSKSRAEFVVPKPARFGYASRRGQHKRAKGRALWWELIDVHTFCELPDGWGEPDAIELLRFGLDLRAWANEQRLPVLTSASSYGSRLLRDARFGAGWRRKVPAATNRALRAKLPGNHYQLLGATGMTHASVHKLDQHAAHHYAAATARFPHPDLLEATGWYRRPAPREGASTERDGGAVEGLSADWYELLRRPGIFTMAIHVDELTAIDSLMIPALRHAGTHWRTVTSVELEHIARLRQQGHRIGLGDIWCAWTSPEVDERLNEFAWWATERIDRATPATRRWMKPALLAAYGMLAAKPRRFRNVWCWCSQPEGAVGFQTRYGALVGYEKAGKRERESQTANVLWRALIESSVRLESLTFAQRLRADGFRPVAVYADAVFVAGDGEPATPVPWRYEGVVHDLTFETPSRYRSREETRLPGTRRRDAWQGVHGGRITTAPEPGGETITTKG